MLAVLALGLVCQHLELAQEVIEAGEPVEVRAVDSDGGPIAGLSIEVVEPGGTTRAVGITGPGGAVEIETLAPGPHELRARLPGGGPLLVTPFRVTSRPRRWLYALVAVPLGVVLLFRNAQRLRRPAVPRPSGPTPGPSPPAP